MQFVNLERIKTSKNQQESIKNFFNSKIEIVKEELPGNPLGASKIHCCKYQGVRNILQIFNLNKGETE